MKLLFLNNIKIVVTLWQVTTATLKLQSSDSYDSSGQEIMTIFFASLSTCKGQLTQTAIEEMTPLFLRKRWLEKQSKSELWTTFLYSEKSRTRRKQELVDHFFAWGSESWWVRLSTERQFKFHREHWLGQSRWNETKKALQIKREEEKQ